MSTTDPSTSTTLRPIILVAVGMLCLSATGSSEAAGYAMVRPQQELVSRLLGTWLGQSESGNRNLARPGKSRASANQPLSEPGGTTDQKRVEEFWNTVRRIDEDLTQRQLPLASQTVDGGSIAWIVDRAAIGFFYRPTGPTRYAALRLAVGNRTETPLTVDGSTIRAVIDGVTFPLAPLPDELQGHGFNDQNISIPLRLCTPPEKLEVPPGGIATAWLIFPELGAETTVPPVSLQFQFAGAERSINATAHQRAVLDLSIERIGPQQGLALLTIGGTINTFNIQSIVDEMETLISQKAVRCVLRWRPTAAPLSSQISGWLQLSVSNSGTPRFRSDQLPTIPVQMRELHIVQPPQGKLVDPNALTQPGGPTRFHGTDAEAVTAALRTNFFTVSPEQLRGLMTQGHPLVRAAALVHGCRRLGPEDLPMMLALTEDEDPLIRQAALRALGESGESAALDRLAQAIRGGSDDAANVAIDVLADSRFESARQRLRELLAENNSDLTHRIIMRLAAAPRPAWSDALYEYASRANEPPSIEVLAALVQVDHPRVIDLLAACLSGSNVTLRDFAFGILSRRNDERSYRLSLESVLLRLPQESPDPAMLEFLNRSRDRRLLPALSAKLNQSGDKSGIINLLGQMGDRETGDRLIAGFDKFSTSEQLASISALRQLRHPAFLEVAERGLNSSNQGLGQVAIQSLIQEGSPAAIALLIRAFEQAEDQGKIQNLVQGLATLATPETRRALQAGAASENTFRRDASKRGLENLKLNSPARNSLFQAVEFSRSRKWKEAAELFAISSELDPYSEEAFVGLGDASVKLEDWPRAEVAFRKALELSPEEGNSISGLAIAQMMLGQREAALKLIDEARPRFAKDPVFRYNTACVFGRGLGQLLEAEPSAERDANIERFRKLAFEELSASLDLGFNEIDWMQEDPDLKSLHDTPRFRELVQQAQKAQKPE